MQDDERNDFAPPQARLPGAKSPSADGGGAVFGCVMLVLFVLSLPFVGLIAGYMANDFFNNYFLNYAFYVLSMLAYATIALFLIVRLSKGVPPTRRE